MKGGPELSVGNRDILFFALADAEIKAGKVLQKGWAAGGDPKLKANYDLGQIKFLLYLSFISFFSKQEKTVLENKAEMDFSFYKNLSLRISLFDAASKKKLVYIFANFSF